MSVFLIDLVLNFFSAYYDDEDDLIIDRTIIALRYLKSWFFIDFIAIIPFGAIASSTGDMSSLSRLAKLPRLYRLLKMTKYSNSFNIK
jgi:hypothetical protein